MQISHGADHFGEYTMDDADGQLVAMVTGYIKQITTWTVREDNESLGVIVIEGLEMHKRRMRDGSEHLDLSLEAEFYALFIGAPSRAVLDDFDRSQLPGVETVLIERVFGLCGFACCQVYLAKCALAELADRAPEFLGLLRPAPHHYILCLVLVSHVFLLGVGNTTVACVARGRSRESSWSFGAHQAALRREICLAVHALLGAGVCLHGCVANGDVARTGIVHGIWRVLANAPVAVAGGFVTLLLRVCRSSLDSGRL